MLAEELHEAGLAKIDILENLVNFLRLFIFEALHKHFLVVTAQNFAHGLCFSVAVPD